MAVDFNAILQRFEQAQQQANQANLQRYQQLLETIRTLGEKTHGTYDEALGQISTVGDAARTRADRNFAAMQGQAEQDLISRGLGNTTIRSSVQRGIASDAELAQQQIDEQQAAARAGVLQNRAGNELSVGNLMAGAIEGRNDIGPDMSLYANLLQAAAAQGDPNQKVAAQVGASQPAIPLAQSLRDRFGTSATGGSPAGAPGGQGGAAGGAGTYDHGRVIYGADQSRPPAASPEVEGQAKFFDGIQPNTPAPAEPSRAMKQMMGMRGLRWDGMKWATA